MCSYKATSYYTSRFTAHSHVVSVPTVSGKGKGTARIVTASILLCCLVCQARALPIYCSCRLQPPNEAAGSWTVQVHTWYINNWLYPSNSHSDTVLKWISTEFACSLCQSLEGIWFNGSRGTLGAPETTGFLQGPMVYWLAHILGLTVLKSVYEGHVQFISRAHGSVVVSLPHYFLTLPWTGY